MLIYWVVVVLVIGSLIVMVVDNWVKLVLLVDNGGLFYLDKDFIEYNKDGIVCVMMCDVYDVLCKFLDGRVYQYDMCMFVYDCKEGCILLVSVLIQDSQYGMVFIKIIDGFCWEVIVLCLEGEVILCVVCQKQCVDDGVIGWLLLV